MDSIWCQRVRLIAYLFKGSVSELENVDNADQSPVFVDYGKVEVVTV
jgi:hypothetical protein